MVNLQVNLFTTIFLKNFECYDQQYNCFETPIALFAAKRVLTLPIYDELTDEQIDENCDRIKKIGQQID